jgi:hypothetical protein
MTTPHDRANDPARKVTGPAWSDDLYGSAYDRAKAFEEGPMNHPAHRNYQRHAIWAPPSEGERWAPASTRREFSILRSHVDKKTGQRGIMAGDSEHSMSFIPNEQIGAMHQWEVDDAPHVGDRADAWNKTLPHTAGQDQAAPFSQASMTFASRQFGKR